MRDIEYILNYYGIQFHYETMKYADGFSDDYFCINSSYSCLIDFNYEVDLFIYKNLNIKATNPIADKILNCRNLGISMLDFIIKIGEMSKCQPMK